MSSHIPITLRGRNLGARHHYLNTLVNEAYILNESFDAIIALPEKSPIDRLFKIDLASKHKHVEYIRKNLQDDDMLYVSRALKSKWLLDEEFQYIVNPVNLENILYPHMITTAVNKMKHWIHLNLRDSVRCQEFYEYYFDKDVDYAFKFLCKCPEEVILKEFPKPTLLNKITPHRFKILCERSPKVAKIFYEMFKKDKQFLNKILPLEKDYFNCLKYILKIDADTFLNIAEEHLRYSNKLSKSATKFIMSQRKERFMRKPEFYTARLLNVSKLAKCLTSEECEELVIKLGQAEYLETKENWFIYENYRPFLNRLDITKRRNVETVIYINKDFGGQVKDWPYTMPASIIDLIEYEPIDGFCDDEESPEKWYDFHKKKPVEAQTKMVFSQPNILNDLIMDEFQLASFGNSLFEQREKITLENSVENRMCIMLFLVKKSRGEAENMPALLKFLLEHRKEPPLVRARVVSSLVNQAYIWRVTDDVWTDFLIFSHGLGFDGNHPVVDCEEGCYAAMLRVLLLNSDYSPAMRSNVINKFNWIYRFSAKLKFLLTASEKQHIHNALLNILIENVKHESRSRRVAQILGYALDTLKVFNVKFETRPDLIACIKNLVRKNKFVASGILYRLFVSKLGRKKLFKENFALIQTEASYVNALKHNITILSADKFVQAVEKDKLNYERFIRKVSVYFNENRDLASRLLNSLLQAKVNKKFARPITYLIGKNLTSYILELDSKDLEDRRFSAIIRANAHHARPAFRLDSLEMHKCGAKLIANNVLKCRSVDIEPQIQQLLTWKRTLRLAIILAQRTDSQADVFAVVAKLKPIVAIKTALVYFKRQGDESDLRIWEIVKPLLVKLFNPIQKKLHLMDRLRQIDFIPHKIRTEYAIEVFKVIREVSFEHSITVLYHIVLLLPNIEEDVIESILYDYIKNRSVSNTHIDENFNSEVFTLYLKLLGKYLVLCKTEETQSRRFNNIGQLYLDRLRSYWESVKNKTMFSKYLNSMLASLKNNEAFINEEYVSCWTILEKIRKWMEEFAPLKKYFRINLPLHLCMLYYKAIRQADKLMPGMLADKQKRRNEGHKIVGEIFGKYVCQDVNEQSKTYPIVVTVTYTEGLLEWMIANFNSPRIIPHVVKGFLEASESIECTVVLHLFKHSEHTMTADEIKEIYKCFDKMSYIRKQFCYRVSSNPIE